MKGSQQAGNRNSLCLLIGRRPTRPGWSFSPSSFVKQPRYEVEHLIYPLSSLVSFVSLFALKAHRYLTDFPQVAELGGTFGLFVGFSFLGVFDVLVDISCSAKNILFKQLW